MSFYRTPVFIHPDAPIHVTSANLTRVTNALDARRQDRLDLGAAYRELTKRLNPSIGPSVVRTSRPATHATIDITDRSPVAGKDTPAAIDLDAQRRDDAARIERGEPLEEMPDIRTQMANVARKAAATEVVIEKLESEFQAEFQKLAAAHCATLKPSHDAKMKQFFKAMGEAFSIFSELQKTKQDLVDSQMGFGALFGVNLEFMRGKEVRSAFHDAKAQGFVASIPKELQ